jgi:hypothetical protein
VGQRPEASGISGEPHHKQAEVPVVKPHPGLVQTLPWDFRTSFPEPLEEAIEAGALNEDDAAPENLRSLHDEHARHALVLLSDLDAVMDARRQSVDPRTGKAPRTPKQREVLEALFRYEPERLQHSFDVLMDVYEEVFGADAAGAFRKAIRAWHAGVEVITSSRPRCHRGRELSRRECSARKRMAPLSQPTAGEVAEITEQLSDQLIGTGETRRSCWHSAPTAVVSNRFLRLRLL